MPLSIDTANIHIVGIIFPKLHHEHCLTNVVAKILQKELHGMFCIIHVHKTILCHVGKCVV